MISRRFKWYVWFKTETCIYNRGKNEFHAAGFVKIKPYKQHHRERERERERARETAQDRAGRVADFPGKQTSAKYPEV